MVKANKYSEQECKELYQIAVEQGWDALELGETKVRRTPMVKANKYSEQECKELYQIAVEQGWDALELGEKIAVGKYCRTHDLPRPTVPTVALQPQPRPQAPAPTVTVPTVKPTPAAPTQEQTPAQPALANTTIEWVNAWPEPETSTPKWGHVAKQLRSQPERIAIIARNLPCRKAGALVTYINSGRASTWAPKGAYEAHRGVGDSPELAHVYACYHAQQED